MVYERFDPMFVSLSFGVERWAPTLETPWFCTCHLEPFHWQSRDSHCDTLGFLGGPHVAHQGSERSYIQGGIFDQVRNVDQLVVRRGRGELEIFELELVLGQPSEHVSFCSSLCGNAIPNEEEFTERE